jgi:uncharacterized protein YodC (DUF2158 family)
MKIGDAVRFKGGGPLMVMMLDPTSLGSVCK